MTATGTGRASAVIAAGTTVSRVLGFGKALALAAVIGNVGVGANAYQTATYVPNSITAIVAGGLLTAVLVPQIVRAAKAPDGGEAYVNKLVTLAVVAFAVVAAVATLASPLLMLISNGAGSDLGLATAFGFWSLPQVFFLGLYTVLGEVLTARRSFGPYMWAPVLNNVVGLAMLAVFALVFGADPGGHRTALMWHGGMVALLAGGATLGLAAQALVLTLAWRAAGLRFRPDFGWRGVGLKATGQAAGWTFAMLLVTQAAGLVEVNVANTTGSTAYPSSFTMAQSWLLFMLPHSIVTVSIVTVFYPRMSEHAADGDLQALRATVGRALTTVLTLLVLADAALIAVAVPFARLFTDGPGQARGMGLVLIAYLVGLVPFSALFVLQRCFYALADTRTPFRFTLAQAATVAIAALLCLAVPAPVRAAAIALAVTLAGVLQLGIAAVLLRRRLGGLGGHEVAVGLRQAVVAGIPGLLAGAAVAVLLGAAAGTGWAVDGKPTAFLAMIAGSLVAAAVFAAALRLQGSRELAGAVEMVARRLRR